MPDEPQRQGMVAPTTGTNAWQLDVTTRLQRIEARLAELYAMLQQVAGKPPSF